MKSSGFFVFLLITTQVIVSCSDVATKEETGAITTATSSESPTAPTVEAKVKNPDAEVQGLKGRVEVLSETVLQAGASKAVRKVYKYDDNGNRTELISYRPDGKVNSTIKSTYDASGRIIKEETILGDGSVDMTSEIKTDTLGNRIEQKDSKGEGSSVLFNFTHSFKYDEQGHLTERTAVRGNGSLFYKYNFTYDASGNKTEWIQTGPDHSVVGRVQYKYDDKNNLIEENVFGPRNTLTATYTYTYEFDKKGNWKRQKKLQNGEVIETRERNISYQ